MPINSIDFAVKFTGELDKIHTEKTKTGFMLDNAFRAQFVGAKSVKIPNIDMQALGDYDRDEGFTRGSISIQNTIYTMVQDRARTFSIDREDLDESGVAALAGKFMSEFVRTKVVPETDAYVLSKIASVALDKGHTLSVTDYPLATKAVDAFLALEENVREVIGEDEELVCFMPRNVYNSIIRSTEFSKNIDVADFKQGEINFRVKKFNEITLIPVSKNKLYTAYDFFDGKTDGQEDGGYSVAANASFINMLMLPKKAASLVKKSETIRVFTPNQNLAADAYKFDYRLYYDVFVKQSNIDTIWALK